uniref:LRRNT domain-containing protein n=1 Tax=Wuchereria bancrofti TaxID=6293 RepID=A0AAF5Q5A3_WUCBA
MSFLAFLLIASLLTTSNGIDNPMPCVNGYCPEKYACNATINACIQDPIVTPVLLYEKHEDI